MIAPVELIGAGMLKGKPVRFVEKYLIDGSAIRAAQAAGYSAQTAYSQGTRLLKSPFTDWGWARLDINLKP